ncbi:n-acetylglutamate synthase [Aquimarina gracilis]|uniref:N-acetylglutamate synthase n=1 Tax=Aquimarina gracilis TaxID=874422 RepID=A0ABU5ZUD5_9FLAO|nr:n-acetylglutamate synthase [Aquimarina gracilis]MEB3345167.1 n-acetylglutamate synthase [Aquimarina gracilis]
MSNSVNGEVSDSTIFHYHQENEIIWAEYCGGDIHKGFLIGKMINQTLEFTYQHLNQSLEIMTGKCKTHIELNEEDKIELHEKWEWTCKDFSKGKSILIEV